MNEVDNVGDAGPSGTGTIGVEVEEGISASSVKVTSAAGRISFSSRLGVGAGGGLSVSHEVVAFSF